MVAAAYFLQAMPACGALLDHLHCLVGLEASVCSRCCLLPDLPTNSQQSFDVTEAKLPKFLKFTNFGSLTRLRSSSHAIIKHSDTRTLLGQLKETSQNAKFVQSSAISFNSCNSQASHMEVQLSTTVGC